MNYLQTIKSKDGTKLYAKVNSPVDWDVYFEDADDINVIIVHGLAEHLDRYDHVAEHLSQNGFNVIRYDQRGHGRSEGTPLYYDHKNQIIEDLESVVDYVKTHFTGPIFLLGHSMGGYAVAMYGTRHPGSVNGIITSGAVTRDNNRFSPEAYGNRQTPADTYFPNSLDEGLSTNPYIRELYRKDAYVPETFSAGLTYAIIDGVIELKNHPEAFVDPVLILHGQKDSIVNPLDSIQFFSEIASEHKSLRIYDHLAHEILNEPSYSAIILQDIVAWIDQTAQQDQAFL
ncbi:alpha/beta hydrolase [Staphylococcus felis]|uniref:alpha/beta hydrolase n=1 Tax=Staphylococcus felis TaxID=46127 RepID=UPI000E225989|nr:alpha/beta hydrolase [Staphylococcus felis]REH79785.1 alpha/beta hydrolase [Staphylococcus felis]REI32235.1 alpha/beta hydrolase [Staphylococcus felis]